jgi:HD-like signal output (HDOD) protein
VSGRVDGAPGVLARHELLPARAGAAARALQLADDPDASAQDLARSIATDPFLAAKLLRVANSSYYGLSGRVGTLPFAVSVVGFQAVRTLAVVAAAGLDDAQGAPEGFWRAAALCATGAELVAPLLGADVGDAFSVGLLHMLGSALLHQDRPPAQLCLPLNDEADAAIEAEAAVHGIAHDALGARVLESWHFPQRLCEVIERHHHPVLPDSAPLERTLHVARALADTVLRDGDEPFTSPATYSWLTEGRLNAPDLPSLVSRIGERSDALLEGLQAR